MAEIVQYRIEKTLDEIKLLVDFGILSKDEAREITNKRENFEYALRKRTKTKLDFLKYIRFEMNLLESIEQYKTTILSKSKNMDEVDRKIFQLQSKKLNEIIRSRAAHISVLYRELTTKFQFDKKLWKAYIDFAKQRKWNSRVSALYWRLLRVAGDDESLWMQAAAHEIETNEDKDTARKLYLLGLRHHPKSEKILSELAEICDTKTLRQYKEDKMQPNVQSTSTESANFNEL